MAAPHASSKSRTPPSCNGNIVTVCEGDNTWTLINKSAPGTSLSAVAQANPQIPNLALIFPGDQICIPELEYHSPRIPFSCTGTIVIVREGDTTNAIVDALVAGTTMDSIMQSNSHIEDFSTIYPGDQLCIPLPPAKCDGIL
jgi:LysM domain